MLGLVSLIKSIAPTRPVLYRSHIQICTDLIAVSGSPQEDVWTFLSADAQMADMFLSHPIPTFVPFDIPREKVAYLPAATDWLDGLNKPLSMWDRMYYTRIYNSTCRDRGMAELAWPARQYIAQVARFDPSKGISTVIDSYAEFRHRTSDLDGNNIPQLVICGNGSIDDPGASQVYSQTIEYLESTYPHLVKDCSITALEPNDQLLNTIISNAHVILQLSTSEGFEVKVSEALHAGRPVITTRVGGLPLQVKDGVSGYLVDVGDYMAVAAHLQDLFRDRELYETMSNSAASSVSDEVGTVGNALSWFYLASRWTETNGRPALCGNQQWVNDMARADAGTPYTEAEKCLPRCYTEKSIKPPIADEAVQDE
jgi:glycosyltransferase involved in cell wall biosynthesis